MEQFLCFTLRQDVPDFGFNTAEPALRLWWFWSLLTRFQMKHHQHQVLLREDTNQLTLVLFIRRRPGSVTPAESVSVR